MSVQNSVDQTPDAQRTDDDLIVAAREGCAASFALLLERHRPLIWRVVYRLARDADEAGDIVQEVFIRLWKTLSRYQTGRSFAAWARVIAVREARRWLRDWRPGARTISLDDLESELPENSAPLAPVVAALSRHQDRAQIDQALLRLSTQQRAAVTLRFFEAMSLAEIAEAMECTEGSVKQHLFRAMARLRRLLPKED